MTVDRFRLPKAGSGAVVLLAVSTLLLLENSVAGFGAVDLYFPLSLFAMPIGIGLTVLALWIRRFHTVFKVLAFFLFLLACVIFSNFIYAYLRNLSTGQTPDGTGIGFFAILVAAFVAGIYIFTSAESAEVQKTSGVTLLVFVVAPIVLFAGYQGLERLTSKKNFTASKPKFIPAPERDYTETHRDRRTAVSQLPPPPAQPVVVFPAGSATAVELRGPSRLPAKNREIE